MFEYLGIMIGVILGLSLTYLVTGLSRLIHLRRTAKLYWVHIVWTFNIVIYVLTLWWSMFWWNNLREWTIWEFFFIVAYCTMTFVVASMLYPPKIADNTDFERYFFDNRGWFFGTVIACTLLDIPETLAKGMVHLRAVPAQYALFISVILAIEIIGLISDNRRVHAILCLSWLAAISCYITFSAVETITIQ